MYIFIWILILISLLLVLWKPPRSPFPWDAWRFHCGLSSGAAFPTGWWGPVPSAHTGRPLTPLCVYHCSLSLCSALPSSLVSPGLWSNPTTQRGLPTHFCLPTLLYCPSFTYILSSVDHLECNPLEGPVVLRPAQSWCTWTFDGAINEFRVW